jgi:hypothetical protein
LDPAFTTREIEKRKKLTASASRSTQSTVWTFSAQPSFPDFEMAFCENCFEVSEDLLRAFKNYSLSVQNITKLPANCEVLLYTL